MFITTKMDINTTNNLGIDEFDLMIHLYEERMKEIHQNNKITG